jgi:hypothetical protein
MDSERMPVRSFVILTEGLAKTFFRDIQRSQEEMEKEASWLATLFPDNQ